MKKTKETRNTKLNKNKGITLIAVVITIVLMVILLSVTVNVVIDRGLFNYAKKAKGSTEIASEKETVQKAALIAESTSKTGRVTVEEMQNAINKVANKKKINVIDDGDRIVIKYVESNRYYQVDNKGNIEGPIEIITDNTPGELDGKGTEAEPFIIMSIEDLVFVSKQVNTKQIGYPEGHYILGKSLDFNSDLSYINPNATEYDEYLGGNGRTGLKKQLTEGKGFVPIGNSNAFSGCFDGKNYKIKNMYVNIDGDGGLFGYVVGNNEQTPVVIKNLDISGNVTATNYAGGLIGALNYNYCYIQNIINHVDISSSKSSGGIVGRSFSGNAVIRIEDCINYGDITSNGGTGGIIGEGQGIDLSIINCANYGELENLSQGSYCGTAGILGGGYEPNVKIYNSYNCGILRGGSRVAGIYGHSATSDYRNILANVFNVGKTEKYGWTPGGLAGQDSRFANVINSYYISTYQYGIGWGSVIAGTQYTEAQMKAIDFVNELNTNIENGCSYEHENEDGTKVTKTIDTTGWAKWLYNENSYPTLDLTTIWNGTKWVKNN